MNFKEALEAAPRLIGVFSFVVLVLTVVHEWGYFSILGGHFQTISTTFDYFANALIWLPSTVGILTYIQILDQTVERANDGSAKVSKWFYAHFVPGVLLLITGFLFTADPILNIMLVLGYAAFWMLAKIIPLQKVDGRLWLYKTILCTPMVLLLSYGYGASSAYSDLRKTSDVYNLSTKDKPDVKRQLIMLRSFEKGILLHDRLADRLEFVRWDNVASLSKFATSNLGVGYSCTWFGVLCGKTTMLEP